MDQQLIQQIASVYEGSRHGNSRFMKLMKAHSQEVQTAVDQYLAANTKTTPQGTTTTVVSETPAPAAPTPAPWTIRMPLEELVSIHLNAAGHPNTWFVQNFKKLSESNQALVNTRLVAIGHKPYIIGGPTSGSGGNRSAPAEPKVLTEEQKQAEAALVHLLDEIRLDQEAVQQFTVELGLAEDNTREQLAKLRGVKYDGPLHDPFKNLYKSARTHSRHNRAEVEQSTKCGCFFCRAVFDPKAIYTYSEGDTAMCPNCGMDSVIGDKAGYELSEEFLVAMFRRWYSIPIRLRSVRPIVTPKTVTQVNQPLLANSPSVTDELVVPPHLEEKIPAGIGASLIGKLGDDDDEEDDETRTIPMISTPVDEPRFLDHLIGGVNVGNIDDVEDEDDDDEDDWDDEEDEEEWDDDDEDEEDLD
jgi:hypothetical protein